MTGISLGNSNGVVAGNVWYPTESGLSGSGGFLDRLTQAVDNSAAYQGTLRGLGPALRSSGVPAPTASPSIFSQLLGLVGIGPSQSPSAQGEGYGAPAPIAPPSPTAGAPIAQPSSGSPAGPTSMMGMFGNAISGIESGGNYGAQGPVTKSGDQALGKYQVMASNVGPWTKEVLGQELTPEQFLANPQAQDAVFQGKFGQYLSQTGNARDAASMWFTGRPYAQGASAQDQLGTTGAGYVRKFMASLPGGGGQPSYQGGSASSPDPMMPQARADGPQPSQVMAFAGPGAPSAPPSSQPRLAAAAGSSPASGSPAASQGTSPTAPGQVLGPLMSNPATQQAGTAAWKMFRQSTANGGAQGGLTLPAGLSPADLAQMIATPQTQAMGLSIFEKALYPQITKLSPNESLYANGRFVSQAPSGPVDIGPGHELIDPSQRGGTGGVLASVPPENKIEVVNGRLTATNPLTSASRDITPAGVPTTADLKGQEGLNANILSNVDKSKQQAIAASRTIDAINRTQTALDQGAITGGGAGARLQIRSMISGILGVPDPGVEHTQEFQAAANSKAAELAKQLSNSGHTTNADFNAAKVMSGADINYSMGTLRSIARAQQQLQLDTISRHNASVDEGAKWNTALAKGQNFYKVQVPTNTYDFARAAAYDNARTAIAQHADPNVVRQRLQAAGYDPGQL